MSLFLESFCPSIRVVEPCEWSFRSRAISASFCGKSGLEEVQNCVMVQPEDGLFEKRAQNGFCKKGAPGRLSLQVMS